LKEAEKIINGLQGNLAVGVSGGADSMCLLHLLLSLQIPQITVLHIDHKIRSESQSDSDFVRGYCQENGVSFEVFAADIPQLSSQSGRSIETEARLVRHKFFRDFCDKNDAKLLLAHNLDDQAETILMHIFRGSGTNGLVGMSVVDGNIIRPLLSYSKAEIYEYNQKNNVPHREDMTNYDQKYSRNMVRDLIKRAEIRFPALKKNIATLSESIKKYNSLIEKSLNDEYISEEKNDILLSKEALENDFAADYILRAMKKAGLKTDYEKKHVDAVLELGKKQTGAKINLPHSIVAILERNNIRFHKTENKSNENQITSQPQSKTIDNPSKIERENNAKSIVTDNNSNKIESDNNSCQIESENCLVERNEENQKNEANLTGQKFNLGQIFFGDYLIDSTLVETIEKRSQAEKTIYADYDVLAGSILRNRQNGDVFRPFSSRNKKLSDYFVEKKIENFQKDKQPLLVKDGRVLAVLGLEISDEAKVTSRTKNIIKICLSQANPKSPK
jgi:tRNA(Ile)-lysidine synthase